MVINITPINVIESTIMYGIVHGIWVILKMVYRKLEREARSERNRIIKRHVKAGHGDRLKLCPDPDCLSLRNPVLSPQVSEVQALRVDS